MDYLKDIIAEICTYHVIKKFLQTPNVSTLVRDQIDNNNRMITLSVIT